MKNITVTYEIVLDGNTHRHTETREACDIRDAHFQIMYAWYGVEKITFLSDTVEDNKNE